MCVDGQHLISWRRSLPLPTNPVWWGSMHAISSYRGNRPTHKHTNRQDRLQYTAPQLASAQCKNAVEMYHRMQTWAQTKRHRVRTPETTILTMIRYKTAPNDWKTLWITERHSLSTVVYIVTMVHEQWTFQVFTTRFNIRCQIIDVGAGGERGIGPPLSGLGITPPTFCCNIGKKYQNLLRIA